MPKYKIGDVVQCTVTGIEKYGFFVNVDDEYSGLVHISEVSEKFVRNVADFVVLNERIYASVIEVDEDNKQLKLSIKYINYRTDGSLVNNDNGFLILRQNLPKWIEEAKSREY